jgi:hypothetical protein
MEAKDHPRAARERRSCVILGVKGAKTTFCRREAARAKAAPPGTDDDAGDAARLGATSGAGLSGTAIAALDAPLPCAGPSGTAAAAETQAEPAPLNIESAITTITLIIQIEGWLNTAAVCGILPISKVETTMRTKRKKKKVRASEVVKNAEQGAIVSVRSVNSVRGIIRSDKNSAFQNSITVDLFFDGSIVSVKLSRDKVQLCGATSDEQGRRAVQYLLDLISAIQSLLNWQRQHPGEAAAVHEQLARDAKGWFEALRTDDLSGESDEKRGSGGEEADADSDAGTGAAERGPRQVAGALERKSWADWSSIAMLGRAPGAQLLYEFLGCRYEQFKNLATFLADLEWFRGLRLLCDEKLLVTSVFRSMLNMRYDLKHSINLHNLKCFIYSLSEKRFFAHYDAACEKFLIAESEGSVPQGRYHRRKNSYFHTFMIYRSGVVTQSGLGDAEMVETAQAFMELIADYLALGWNEWDK